jgi:replicative DNA helicase Mcm
MQQPRTLLDDLVEFYERYYRQDIGTLAQSYPSQQSLYVAWTDVRDFDLTLADELLSKPDELLPQFAEAVDMVDLPLDVDLSDVTVRITDLPEQHVHRPADLSTEHAGYIGVVGDLERVTSKDEIATVAAFECQRCGTTTEVPQRRGEFNEPHECSGCERQGPFNILSNRTEWEDFCRVRLKTPPEHAGSPDPSHIDGHLTGDIIHEGGEHGIIGRAGQRVVAYGILERQEKDNADGLFERVLDVRAVEFPDDDERIDVAEHRDTFEDLAARDDAVDLLAESIAPALYATDAWEAAMEWAVAYLFGAPRLKLDDGTVYRGDIHGAIISDYGMGKSMFSHGVENLSPDCIRKSATGLSSDVGLTAAAVKDDFGDGQWTLKPGILVRGNGGHVILDEIDKGPGDLEAINDAIEGQQRVDVEKAGLDASYNSRVGLLVLGNPEDGRFERHESVADQLDVDPSFLSRLDGIITMQDVADEDIDAKVADQIAEGFAEANQLEFGDLDADDLDALDRPVETAVARAWIQHAREQVHPTFEKERIPRIREWYAEEVRQLNGSDDENMPVPVTARVVMWVIRFSTAFARCHLHETVRESDVERALALAKRLIAQNWDGEKFVPEEARGSTQQDRLNSLHQIIREHGPMDVEAALDRAADHGIARETAEHEMDKLRQKGDIYHPEHGRVDAT